MIVDHVGVATDDAETFTAQYVELLDCELVHEETFDGMWVGFLDLGNCYLEVLEPLDTEGPIARYLDEHGSGIHHVAFGTDDIEAALDRARECDVEPIDDRPREGAWGHRVAFLHPSSTGGVLVEFVET